jgi:hypothetical protein
MKEIKKNRKLYTLVECFQFTIHHAHECAARRRGCNARAMTDRRRLGNLNKTINQIQISMLRPPAPLN